MSGINSFLEFEDYKISKSYFEINNDFAPEEEEEVSVRPRFSVEHFYTPKMDKVAVELSCSINEEDFTKNNVPFYLEVVLIGYFSLSIENESNSDDEISHVLAVNTVSILFPYLRSIITNLTALANIEPLIIPPINIHKLLASKRSSD